MHSFAHLCLRATLAAGCALLALGPAAAAQSAKPNSESQKYIGPGSCAATSCHGSVKPVAGSRILQTEYTTWILKDKHSRAYQALTSDVAERMARILKLGAKAEESPKCLACHALYAAPEQRGRAFEISEGVSCENCHGPASAWLGAHTTRDWPHEKSVVLGMHDTRNVPQDRVVEKVFTQHRLKGAVGSSMGQGHAGDVKGNRIRRDILRIVHEGELRGRIEEPLDQPSGSRPVNMAA